MILAGGVILAVLGLILTVRMYRTGLAVGPVPAAAMIVFAIAMVLVGAFPTDPPPKRFAKAQRRRKGKAADYRLQEEKKILLPPLGCTRQRCPVARRLQPAAF